MRPPDLPGGNDPRLRPDWYRAAAPTCFNEAAGFTRRKRRHVRSCRFDPPQHKASMRPPDLPGGNSAIIGQFTVDAAESMELQ